MNPCLLKLLWSWIFLIATVPLTRTTEFRITMEINLGVCKRESLRIGLIKVGKPTVNAVAPFSGLES